jgi:hypothetical protein
LTIFVMAGTRPFLQASLPNATTGRKKMPKPGHKNSQEWSAIISHCEQLTKNDVEYERRVSRAVSSLISTCSRTVHDVALFYDVLDVDEYRGQRGLGFDTEFTM